MERSRAVVVGGIAAAVAALAGAARAATIVQLSVDGLLDGRPVSTLTGGVIVPWTSGLDADDALMTAAAAASLHQTGPAFPDDGIFPANAEHPEIRLHVSNAAAADRPQAHLVTAVGSFVVPVPPTSYEKVILLLTGSYGDAPLTIEMMYADGSTTSTTLTLPDWGTGKALPRGLPTLFYLVSGLHKWTKGGASVDTPSHAITGVVLAPAAGRTLTSLQIAKTTAAPWLTFWGATGVVVDVVDAGSSVGDASDAGDARATTDDAADASDARLVAEDLDAKSASLDEGTLPGGATDAGARVDANARDVAADTRASARPSSGCAFCPRPAAPRASLLAGLLELVALRGLRRRASRRARGRSGAG